MKNVKANNLNGPKREFKKFKIQILGQISKSEKRNWGSKWKFKEIEVKI